MKTPYGNPVRNHLWIWGHEAGSHNAYLGTSVKSRMTPSEAAFYMGIPNLIFVVFNNTPQPPFDQHALAFSPLKRVVWSIVGDGSSTRNNEQNDLEEVLRISRKYPNINGAMMDDFFVPPDKQPPLSRVSVEGLQKFHNHLAGDRLDLWVVLYQHEMHQPVKEYLDECDVVTFWTWQPERLSNLKENFAHFESIVPNKRKVLGCYMFDYNTNKPIPLDLMKYQCEQGLAWLKEGRIDGMIFLASCICDLEMEAVEWSRDWIARVGDQPVR
jgi:hypothetical protein